MYKILYKLNKKVLVCKWKKNVFYELYIYINIKIFRYVRLYMEMKYVMIVVVRVIFMGVILLVKLV